MKDQNALIYGATGGIGKALSQRLKEEGVNIYAIGRSKSKMEALASELNLDSSHLFCIKTITSEKDIKKVQDWLGKLGLRFNIGIHAAGQGLMKSANRLSLKEWQSLIDINLTSAFTFYQLFSNFRNAEAFELIYFSSASLDKPWPKNSLYGASKAGLEAFCSSLQQEIKMEGGRVWLYRAGSIRTGFFDKVKNHLPFDKMLSPEAIARIAVENLKLAKGIYFPVIPIVSD